MNREILKLYLVTDTHALRGRDFFAVLEAALAGGVTLVQLREKELPFDALKEKLLRTAALCRRYRVPLLIDDHPELVAPCGIDGVHVGQNDQDAAESRTLIGPHKILGVTAKTVCQAQAAQAAGADYLGSGAMFPTATKGDASPMTVAQLAQIVQSVSIPVVAIGGINRTNAHRLCGIGLAGLAISSGLMHAENVYETAKYLRTLPL